MQSPSIHAKERLIVALDLPSIEAAEDLVRMLHGAVDFFKVGLTLQLEVGAQQFVNNLIHQGKRVFLDYKYFDVEETIRTVVERAAELGVTFLTVHGNTGIIGAAVKGRGNSKLKILSVTVLTSLDHADIRELGFECSVEELVLHRARKALDAGCDGVISSGKEASAIRQLAGDNLLIVTPGIRPQGVSQDEHKRASAPGQAIAAGADYLVVGRPITESQDPQGAAERIIFEMQEAFDSRLNSADLDQPVAGLAV